MSDISLELCDIPAQHGSHFLLMLQCALVNFSTLLLLLHNSEREHL